MHVRVWWTPPPYLNLGHPRLTTPRDKPSKSSKASKRPARMEYQATSRGVSATGLSRLRADDESPRAPRPFALSAFSTHAKHAHARARTRTHTHTHARTLTHTHAHAHAHAHARTLTHTHASKAVYRSVFHTQADRIAPSMAPSVHTAATCNSQCVVVFPDTRVCVCVQHIRGR